MNAVNRDDLAAALRTYLDPLPVTPPKHIPNGYEWPARCLDCGLVTEDPDAYVVIDEETDAEKCCPLTGAEHRWANVEVGLVRFVYPEALADMLLAALPPTGSPETLREALTLLDRQRSNPYSDGLDNGERWAGWVEGFDAARGILRAALEGSPGERE